MVTGAAAFAAALYGLIRLPETRSKEARLVSTHQASYYCLWSPLRQRCAPSLQTDSAAIRCRLRERLGVSRQPPPSSRSRREQRRSAAVRRQLRRRQKLGRSAIGNDGALPHAPALLGVGEHVANQGEGASSRESYEQSCAASQAALDA